MKVTLNGLELCTSASVARHYALLDQALALEARLESELRGDRNIILNGQILERLQIDESVWKY